MIIYTDGSCSNNPGPGGFGVIVLDDNENYICHHYEQVQETTNNREEMKAILWAFFKYGSQNEYFIPTVYSDSRYAVLTFTNWMFNWEHHGWLKPDGKTPENLDLVQLFYKHWRNGYRINLEKVHGHSGQHWNEKADQLARTGSIENE